MGAHALFTAPLRPQRRLCRFDDMPFSGMSMPDDREEAPQRSEEADEMDTHARSRRRVGRTWNAVDQLSAPTAR
jgi:hypothetical protein